MRWVLELADGWRLMIDLLNDSGLWSVEKFLLPARDGENAGQATANDSLAVADVFLQAVLNQKFEIAVKVTGPWSAKSFATLYYRHLFG